MIKIRNPNLKKIATEHFRKINPEPKTEEDTVNYGNLKVSKDNSVIGEIHKIVNDRNRLDNNKLIHFYEFLLDKDKIDLLQVFSGDMKTLIEINKKISLEYKKIAGDSVTKDGKKIKCGTHILDTFDYKGFRSNDTAYWFADSLDVKVCPYCNREYTFRFRIYRSKTNSLKLNFDIDQKVLFDFDHFLAKEKYPYFSVSFFNLIPSCSICNSRFKHSIEFDADTFIYPHDESFENEIKFSLDLKTKILKNI